MTRTGAVTPVVVTFRGEGPGRALHPGDRLILLPEEGRVVLVSADDHEWSSFNVESEPL